MPLQDTNPCSITYEVLCHCEEQSDVAISRKGIILNPTQDTFVLAGKRSTQVKEWALSLAITWFQKRSVRRVAGALHIRAKVPYGHRTPKLRFGFSAAHRRNKKITTKSVVIFLWCRWPDSNRHGIATGGFWVHYVCQFHHTGTNC